MRKKRTTKITVETERVFVISSRKGEVRGWCDGCRARVSMITSDKAAALAGISLRSICYLIESGKLHFTETTERLLLICFNSLIEFTAVGKEPSQPARHSLKALELFTINQAKETSHDD